MAPEAAVDRRLERFGFLMAYLGWISDAQCGSGGRYEFSKLHATGSAGITRNRRGVVRHGTESLAAMLFIICIRLQQHQRGCCLSSQHCHVLERCHEYAVTRDGFEVVGQALVEGVTFVVKRLPIKDLCSSTKRNDIHDKGLKTT
jgi:hypothetical protein